MRRTALRILNQLQEHPATIAQLADALDKNQGWISELVTGLENQNLVTKNATIELANTYEARLLQELATDYDIEMILDGKREEILQALLDKPQTASGLEKQGFAQSTVYQSLRQLRATGILEETSDGYQIADETLRDFLETRTSTDNQEYNVDGETILRISDREAEGRPTAFSTFTRYGIEYYPSESYLYRGEKELELEDVLIHAVRFADSMKQMAITGVFYLKHSASLNSSELWRLARKWDCIEKWADLLAYLDQRSVKQEDLFLPWEEFTNLARDYDVYPRDKHPEESLLRGLEDLGDTLDEEVDAYLLGGGNLTLRGLKDSTKDLDVVVTDRPTLTALVEALQKLGYEERRDIDEVYEQLDPSIVLEKQGFPRWDIFVETIAGALSLTPAMKQRSDRTETFGYLNLHLLSLEDIFLLKSITEREGDLEDNALIARQGRIDWQYIFEEIQTQEDVTERYFSFAVLDTLDLLEDRYNIEPPIHQRLVSYCLENALLVTLTEPKTINDLREELDQFPDHQIYNKLRKLENDGLIEVDRSGGLNTYQAV